MINDNGFLPGPDETALAISQAIKYVVEKEYRRLADDNYPEKAKSVLETLAIHYAVLLASRLAHEINQEKGGSNAT